MSRKTAQVSGGDTGTAPQYNFLRDEARASSWLLAYGTSTIKVMINAGLAYFGGDKVEFAGGYSPLMTEPTASSRIDVISMTSAGEIAVTAGTEADTPVAPTYPEANIPICEVYHKAGEVEITDEEEDGEGYINKDLRTFVRRKFAFTIVSDNLQKSLDAVQATGENAYTLLKSYQIPHTGFARVKFDIKTGDGGYASHGRIYLNAVAFGTDRSTNSMAYVTKSEDLFFHAGDIVSLYAYIDPGAFNVFVRNFRFYWDIEGTPDID